MKVLHVAASLGLLAANALARGDASLLPTSGFLGTWSVEGDPKVFTGSELYGYIDGGSEIFFELGFEEATVQRYRSGPNELVVECYRMTDPLGALGIYLGKCGRETPDPGFAERHTAGHYQLTFGRDRYFVIVDNPAGTPTLAQTLVEFARAIASRLPASRPVMVFDVLPRQGLVAGSLRLIRGPVGLEAIATLGNGDVLMLGGRITAVAGEYADGKGRHTLIVVTYPNAEVAHGTFRHLVGGLDPEIKPLVARENRLVFRDYDGSFGEASLSGPRLEISLHLVGQPAAK